MTVEEVRGSLDLTDNGAIKNSIRNCLTVFQNDPVLQGAVRYNILTERIDIVKPLWWSKQTATLTDTDLNYLMLYLEDKYSLTSEKKIQKALSIIADSNKYHPIRDYLNGLEWDGTERIRYALPRFLGAEEGEYTYQALRLFMLGAISRVFKPGCKFEVTVREQELYEEMELTPEMIKSIRTLCATCLRHFVEAKAFKIALVPSADKSMDVCTVCQTRRGHDYVVMHR